MDCGKIGGVMHRCIPPIILESNFGFSFLGYLISGPRPQNELFAFPIGCIIQPRAFEVSYLSPEIRFSHGLRPIEFWLIRHGFIYPFFDLEFSG